MVALTQPARLSKALDMLDTSKDGEMDMDEWMAAIKRGLAKRLDELADERERRERAAAAADEEFSAEFLNMARKVRFLRPIKPPSPPCHSADLNAPSTLRSST